MKPAASPQGHHVPGDVRPISNDAVFLNSGDPHKNPLMNAFAATTVPDSKLLSFDLDWNPLRKHLDSLMGAVNQHAQVINVMYGEIRTKISEVPVSESFTKIADSMMLFDTEFTKLVAAEAEKPPKVGEGDSVLSDSSNMVTNKMNFLGHAITWLYRRQIESEKGLRAKIKRGKGKLKKLIEDTSNKLTDRMNNLDKKVNDLEVSTLWRIKDCEELLRVRVNEQFVLDAVKTIEDKISTRFLRMNEGNYEHFQGLYNELKAIVDRFLEDFADKNATTKERLDIIDESMGKKVTLSKFEEVRKTTYDRLDDLMRRIREHSGVTDPALERVNQAVNVMQGNINEIEKTLLEITHKFENMSTFRATLPVQVEFHSLQPSQVNLVGRVGGVDDGAKLGISTVGGQSMSGAGYLDPKKLEFIENSIADLRRDVDMLSDQTRLIQIEQTIREVKKEQGTMNLNIAIMKDEMKDKPDNSAMTLALLKKSDKDEVAKTVEDRIALEAQVKKVVRDTDDLTRKVDIMSDGFEKRMIKLKKEFDISAIQKLIRDKADTEFVRKEMGTFEGKMTALADLLATLKKDYENVHSGFKKLNNYFIFQQTDNSANTLISTKACLSCGKGDMFANPVHKIRGSDGKFYKADAGGSLMESGRGEFDGLEVFGKNDFQAASHMESRHHDSSFVKPTSKPTVSRMPRPASAQIKNRQSQQIPNQFTAPNIASPAQLHVTNSMGKFRPGSAKPQQ